MRDHYRKIIRDTEERVVHSLRNQNLDKESERYGGFFDDSRMIQAKYTIYRVASEAACYLCKDTRFYHNEKVYESMMLGLDYVRRVQHENGLFDYITCNFFSAPDTAFCIKKLVPLVDYLRTLKNRDDKEAELYEKVSQIVHDGMYGLLEGGFHTPNHRWAIASLLCKGSVLYNDERLKKAAFEYLKEGIDCNEDGEFAEKSAGNYNRVNNDAMIMLSEALSDPSYEECAVRNLKLMLTYFEPDGSIFTANSTRFDKDHLVFPKDYYMEYLQMGLKYNIPEFLGVCNWIIDLCDEKGITTPDFLIWFMLHPEYIDLNIEGSFEQKDFERFLEWSGIYRSRVGNHTLTLMRGKSNFLYFHTGTIKVSMKVAGSFCEHRAFIPETMEIEEDGTIKLSQVMKGWYYLPYDREHLPDTNDWWKMENETKRPKKFGPNLAIDVYVKKVPGGVDVTVKTSGVKGAPFRVEIAFSGIDFMQNEHMAMPVDGSEVIVLKDGTAEMYNRNDSVTVGPCFGLHRFTEGKEDSELKTAGAATLYLTDYTEFEHTISFRNKRDEEE